MVQVRLGGLETRLLGGYLVDDFGRILGKSFLVSFEGAIPLPLHLMGFPLGVEPGALPGFGFHRRHLPD